jgi:hypothetical protein
MLLDELKILIKDFEGILSKDLRFKDDMYFKNQVKIIYGEKEKVKNVFVPLMLANLSNSQEVDEVTKLKDRIKYLEKIETIPEEQHVCPKVEPQDCSKCATHVCPPCNCPKVEPHVCPPCNCPKVEPHVCPPCNCPKVEPHVCPKVEPQDCSKCATHVCPPCNCPKLEDYERGDLPESDTIRKNYNEVTRHIETTSSEEDDLNTLYSTAKGALKFLPIEQQVQSIKELIPERVKNRSDDEIKAMINKYNK